MSYNSIQFSVTRGEFYSAMKVSIWCNGYNFLMSVGEVSWGRELKKRQGSLSWLSSLQPHIFSHDRASHPAKVILSSLFHNVIQYICKFFMTMFLCNTFSSHCTMKSGYPPDCISFWATFDQCDDCKDADDLMNSLWMCVSELFGQINLTFLWLLKSEWIHHVLNTFSDEGCKSIYFSYSK